VSFSSGLISTYGWIDFEALPSALITDYCERGTTRLIEQFEKKPNIVSYLCALLSGVQTTEFVYGDLLVQRILDNAAGAQLDGIGDIVGIERKGLTDDQYRTAIRFQIGVNFSNGEPETLIEVTRFVTEANEVHLSEDFPAKVNILTDGSVVSPSTVSILEESAPAGVKIGLTSSYGSLAPFAVDLEPGDSDPDAQGFSEPNYVPDDGKGGQLVEKFI